MYETMQRPAVAALAVLLSLAALAVRAEAQDRPSPVTIRGGHVYVDGHHVGRLRTFQDRNGLARIVNPLVGPAAGGLRRLPDAGTGRLPAPPPRPLSGRAPRIGTNGILLGGEIPLGGRFFCLGCGLPGRRLRLAGPPLVVRSAVGTETTGPPGVATGEEGTESPSHPPAALGRLAPSVSVEPEWPLRREWRPGEGTCAAVTVILAARTAHRLEMPLESLGTETPEAARQVLEERLRRGGVLRLEGFSGRGLLVPAGLVEGIDVARCDPSSGASS